MSANKTGFPETLTNPETPALDSPVVGRGRGTTGGGGKTLPESRALMGARLGVSSTYTNKALSEGLAKYWLSKPGCGVPEHDADCLCDVHVSQPTPIGVSFPHDITFANVICEHMGFEAPYKDEDVLTALQMVGRAKDMLSGPRDEYDWRENQKVPHDAREFMRECAEAGMRNKEVRQLVLEGWGVTVSPAYISKRRYLYTGQRGTKK